MKFAVFASGYGTNLQAIIDAVGNGEIKAEIGLVFSNKRKAHALKRAGAAGIKTLFLNPKDYTNIQSFERDLLICLKEEKIDFIVLAGYMKMFSPFLVKQYKDKIMNVHPAILPSFKGIKGIKDTFTYGCKVAGVTIHFVDEKMDHGPIILQDSVKVQERDTLDSLDEKVHNLEHKNYPQSLGYTSTYADWYQEKQQGLLSAANRSFADLAEDEPSPQFFVLVVADIVSGVEIESILYFEDLRHGLSIAQALPQDEFLKRFVYELRGKEDIIGDSTGQHINYTDISFPQFLAKQITTRINFKYQRSSFPPSANTREELKKIIIEAFDAYDYEDYSTVKLHNLAEDSTESLTSSQLSQLAKELDVSSGKFHVINFR